MKRWGPVLALIALATGLLLWWQRPGPGRATRSRPVILARNQEKAVGTFDPHLHVAVLEVRRTKIWQGPGGPRTTEGWFYDVLLRARNDAARIDVRPWLSTIAVLDEAGHRYAPLPVAGPGDGEDLYGGALDVPLARGQTTLRRFLFELPSGTRAPLLWVDEDRGFVDRLVPRFVFDLLHDPAYFELDPAVAQNRP